MEYNICLYFAVTLGNIGCDPDHISVIGQVKMIMIVILQITLHMFLQVYDLDNSILFHLAHMGYNSFLIIQNLLLHVFGCIGAGGDIKSPFYPILPRGGPLIYFLKKIYPPRFYPHRQNFMLYDNKFMFTSNLY